MAQSIGVDEARELRRLNTEYCIATRRAAALMSRSNRPLEGAALDAVREAERRADRAVLRIREIKGAYPQAGHGAPVSRIA